MVFRILFFCVIFCFGQEEETQERTVEMFKDSLSQNMFLPFLLGGQDRVKHEDYLSLNLYGFLGFWLLKFLELL